jgi:two-component system, OmpR family, sensor histidine kinase MprB
VTFRTRVIVFTAGAVALIAIAGSVLTYYELRAALRDQVDSYLRERAGEAVLQSPPGTALAVELPPEPLGANLYTEIVLAQGSVPPPPGRIRLAPSARARRVAAGEEPAYFEDVVAGGVRVRVLTTQAVPGLAIRLGRSLEEVDATLEKLRLVLLLVALVGTGAAVGAGFFISRKALVPVRRLSEATTHVRATGDLARRVDVRSDDELGRLAQNFNGMLAELERAVASQRQLVADASHELRTPLTSLRANLELLLENGLDDDERAALLDDLIAETRELTNLVADLVELARDGERREALEECRFDELVEGAVERARRRSPDLRFDVRLEPTPVQGAPERLARAVSNLVDNATKWSPPGGTIEVELREGELVVRDHGPGIPPADLPHVFDRFYRAAAARGTPGSGLGLAIVRQVALSHGGSAVVENAAGGGARVRLRLPVLGTAAAVTPVVDLLENR